MATPQQMLTNIANAIRGKTGKTAKMTLPQMVTEINSLSGALPTDVKRILGTYKSGTGLVYMGNMTWRGATSTSSCKKATSFDRDSAQPTALMYAFPVSLASTFTNSSKITILKTQILDWYLVYDNSSMTSGEIPSDLSAFSYYSSVTASSSVSNMYKVTEADSWGSYGWSIPSDGHTYKVTAYCLYQSNFNSPLVFKVTPYDSTTSKGTWTKISGPDFYGSKSSSMTGYYFLDCPIYIKKIEYYS